MDFIAPQPQQADPCRALEDHLGYGKSVVSPEKDGVEFVLLPHEARQLLYELTDDKRWIA